MAKTTFNSELFKFAVFPSYENAITHLAETLSDKEEWDWTARLGRRSIRVYSNMECVQTDSWENVVRKQRWFPNWKAIAENRWEKLSRRAIFPNVLVLVDASLHAFYFRLVATNTCYKK